jgi:hypothetical protein
VEISLQPWNSFKPDGVILFSDILTPLPSMVSVWLIRQFGIHFEGSKLVRRISHLLRGVHTYYEESTLVRRSLQAAVLQPRHPDFEMPVLFLQGVQFEIDDIKGPILNNPVKTMEQVNGINK